MTTIRIDNKEYNLDSLSTEAKAQLTSLQFCDVELQHLTAQLPCCKPRVPPMPKPCKRRSLRLMRAGRHDEVQLSDQTGGLTASISALLPSLALAFS